MRTILILSAIVFSQAPAMADSVTCFLTSGKKSVSATLDLTNPSQDFAISDNVYDLSFNLSAECKRSKKCMAYITVDSIKLEDEAGSTGFEFERGGVEREIFREPVEGAPDRRKYEMYCDYKN